jgi:mRNA interferase MazF
MVDFGPPSGPEQAGHRPAVVLQDDVLNDALTTVIVIPLTTNLRRLTLPATLRLEAGEGGLTQDSVLLGYQIQVRGNVRLLYKMGELSAERVTEVQDAVLTALGM